MKIYIFSPGNVVTGGPEALHQLCDSVNKQQLSNTKALMFYYSIDLNGLSVGSTSDIIKFESSISYTKPEKYSVYEGEVCNSFVVEKDTVCVVPEVSPILARSLSKVCKVVYWWLSVDNSFGPLNSISLTDLRSPRILHACQSKYAEGVTKALGFSNVIMLSDYISHQLFMPFNEKRENRILYNPIKQSMITNNFIEQLGKYFTLYPLQGLSSDQLRHLFTTSKIYLDSGHHPGKDRMPREAMLFGCISLILQIGAGANDEDYRQHELFKIPVNDIYREDKNQEINKLIEHIFNDFDAIFHLQDTARKNVVNEEMIFHKEVREMLIKINYL